MRKKHPVIYLLDDSGCFVRRVWHHVFVFVFLDASERTHGRSHTPAHRQRGVWLAAN